MNISAPLCAPTADAAFGPVVDAACRGGFDFTLVFEQSIFVLLPASLLILVAPLRLIQLRKASVKVTDHVSRAIKLAVTACLAALQLVLIALWATHNGPARLNGVSIAAASVSFASSLMSCALSYYEHARSLAPSSLLNVFLLVSLLLDAAVLRTVWLSLSRAAVSTAIQAVLTASFGLKAALLVLEAREKSGHVVGRQSLAPEETSGLYNRAVFAWVAPLLRTGFKRLLQPADLFPLDEKMGVSGLNERFWWHWRKASPSTQASKHRLIFCCIITLRSALISVIVPRLALLAFTICQPLVLTRFLGFLNDETQPDSIGYGLVGAYGLVYLGIAATQALYWHQNGRCVTMLRGILVSAVFTKVTDVSVVATDDSAALTLMSSDVDVIGRAMREIHEFWANVFQIGIATWLLSKQIGYAAAGPIIVSVLSLVATMFVSPLAGKYQVGWLEKTQRRVGITSAMIGHIKSIKMSGLSKHLSATIASLRAQEISASKPFRVVGAVTSSVAQIPLLLSPVLAFAMYQGITAATGQELDATRMFSALSLITLLAQPLFWVFEVVLDLSAAFGAFSRIQAFLVKAAREEYRTVETADVFGPSAATGEDAGLIELQPLNSPTGHASSSSVAATYTTAVDVEDATFAWSPEHQVLSNISFSLKRGHFALVIGPVASGKTTLLKGLLGEVPHFSGKVFLASSRLSWCEQTPWILDLYDQTIRACELEDDFWQLPQGDFTVVGSKGLALSGGQKQRVALARAVYSRPRIALFDDIFSGLDNATSQRIFKNLFSSTGLFRQWETTVVLATQTVEFLASADLIIALGHEKITEQGSLAQLQATGGYVQTLTADKPIGRTSDSGQDEIFSQSRDSEPTPKMEYKAKQVEVKEDKRRQLGDSTVYKYYFGSIGTFFITTLLVIEVVWAFLQSFPNSNRQGGNHSGYYLGIYAALQIIGVFWFALLIWFVLVVVAAKSGISLHQRLLSAVVKFSQDIGILDKNLPLALVVTIASFFGVLARAGLLAASSYYVAISFPFLAALYYFLQRGYLRTSRQLRLLDLEEKAPVYTQFMETLAGISTIRAFGWQKQAILKNHQLVDRSQKPFYLLIMVQRWLVLVLDLTTTALALLVVGFSVKLRGSVSVGLTGVSLVQLISMSETLNMLIQFWTSIETSIGAVARIKQFAEETPNESLPGEDREVPAHWPHQGHIVIRDLEASYDEDGGIKALDGVTLEMKPGEKVGICGRTGSGKSSLLLALLRLLDPSSGTLTIDSIQLNTISRETIRSRLITVTQDQFVLPGTIRQNIDPSDSYPEEAIIDALHAVNLWAAIDSRGGLDVTFEEDMLSHGQKQLFFLARAVLKRHRGKVVLLDEASSSLDMETEQMVRMTINTHFQSHTVISIAHHLETILDFDRVVVMDKGRVVEVGSPRELLQSAGNGKFKALWEANGRGGLN
ncbi:P-loop containing nucleoside triphosphate hydrolase protein [Trichoderma citrinoviride]|uniref:P-loop containing nucleoside triphosphate hydrolase protein n=1 Tax=Trichoderma citrinoviride TaxID=58853 RepID=A0A2T4BMY5_9HYPO|nr:P-loop containing nucleoside triphosphate hydrolase protein [Trichoderma citrinoviride]PTB70684.1 P-loop containing nucleoside triphosphate hydrolase protein [Trichoderma citrinoviride]